MDLLRGELTDIIISVSLKFVATAAHCIVRAKLHDVIVYLGELDTQDTGTVLELAPAELHRVRITVTIIFLLIPQAFE